MAATAERLPAEEPKNAARPRTRPAPEGSMPRVSRFRERSPLLHPRAADALIEAARSLQE